MGNLFLIKKDHYSINCNTNNYALQLRRAVLSSITLNYLASYYAPTSHNREHNLSVRDLS